MEKRKIEVIKNITLYTGPMYAGKSTKVIELANQAKNGGKKIICFKHCFDNERFGENKIVSRNEEEIEACSVSTSEEIKTKIQNTENIDLILIDELQFFGINDDKEIENFIKMLRDLSKKNKIILAGLDKTFENKYFPITKRLIEDGLIEQGNIQYLTAECSVKDCNEKATLSARIISNKAVVDVGDGDKYRAVCEGHHCYCDKDIDYSKMHWKKKEEIKKKSSIKKFKNKDMSFVNRVLKQICGCSFLGIKY